MLYVEEQKEEIFHKFNSFLNAYQDIMPSRYFNFAVDLFPLFLEKNLGPDLLMEIYHELDFDRYTHSYYYDQVEFIKNNFDISGNIVDVASGLFPCFANTLAIEQLKIKKGTITIYEPNLISTKPKHPNMILKREAFDRSSNIDNVDLITGIMPCQATEIIIRQACKNHKSFYIQLCNCNHFSQINTPNFILNTNNQYHHYICTLAAELVRQNNNGTFHMTNINNNPIPAIFNLK